ncbi:MAG: hypothetical protein ACHREM_00375 [Polyangiales bacterium]
MDNEEKLNFILRVSQWRPKKSSVVGSLFIIAGCVVYWCIHNK